jgi:hypothetical protein
MDQKLGYLKDSLLTNVPKLVTMAKRIGQYPETDYTTKQPTGRMQTLYTFHLPDGPDVWHYAKEREEETLSLFKPGETLQVVRQESVKDDGKRISFLVWTPPEGAEARMAATPQMGNTRLAGDAKKLEEQKEEEAKKWLRIDTSKIVFGYMNTAMAQGKTPKEAKAIAIDAWKNQEEAIEEILVIHYKGGQEQKFAPDNAAPLHTPSVSIDDVNAAFGPSK